MSHIANISDFAVPRREKSASVPSYCDEGEEIGRLIPGMQSSFSRRKNLTGPWGRSLAAPQSDILPEDRSILAQLLPKFLLRFDPNHLGTLALDFTLVGILYVVESRLLRSAGIVATFTTTRFYFFCLAFALFAFAEDLYAKSPGTTLAQCVIVTKVVIWATLLTSLALKCSHAGAGVFPIFLLSWTSWGAMLFVRKLSAPTAAAGRSRRNVLIVGTGEMAQRVADTLRQQSSLDRSLKGHMTDAEFRDARGPATLRETARSQFIDEVIIASYDRGVSASAIREAERNHLDVKLVPEFFQAEFENVGPADFAGVPLFNLRQQSLPEWSLALKRAVDFIAAFLGLIVLSPLLLLIAFAVKLTSRGPTLYRASRVGLKGRQFGCYKFRTMILEADALKNVLRMKNERSGAFFKISNDPRITRVGGLLRRYSLDELPQLWSVLLGDMSLVGPRPHPPDDVRLYSLQHLQRLDFVPGMTGLWQVTARRDPSFERSVALDVEYIRRWSLSLDFKILWRTIPAVIHGSGQ